MPSLLPSPVAVWLPVSPPTGQGRPSELGSVTSSRKHPCSFPQGAANLAGRRKQMWLHLKAVDFNRVAQDSLKPL